MKNNLILVVLFLLSGSCLFGQSRPFPQNVDYPNGYQTAVISSNDIQTAYNRWKDLYLGSCSGMYRVLFEDTARTVSEGMGYGMLLTAYFGEKGKFDSLFAFYKSKRTTQAHNLMAWNVTCGGIIDPGSATDGDLDVAFALIVAYYQWGEDYLDSAKNMLSILKEYYFDTCEGVYTMKPGGHWGGCELTDISYYTPAYFRVFADETDDPFWDTVAEHTYTILGNGANETTGLVPDWQSYDGVPGGTSDSDWEWRDYYRYDACRVPWRMALDYLWNGHQDARRWCVKISNFANSIGPDSIVDGYALDGTPRGQYNNSPFVGGFAVGGMCNSQSIVDAFASRLLYLDSVDYDNQYFNLSLRCLYMLVLTGDFWKPEPTPGVEKTDYLPRKFNLRQNIPNPFTATTTIEYSIAEKSFVRLKVYNITGQEINTLVIGVMSAGKHIVNFDAGDLSSGIYLYQLTSGDSSQLRKMILMK